MRVPIYAVIYNVTVTCNYLVLASSWVKRELLQPTPQHSPQPAEHDNACFLHVHIFESQLSLQLHRTIFRSLSGAGGTSVFIGLSYRGAYMSTHVLLNLLNKLRKSDELRGILSLFRNEFNKYNNTRAQMLDSIEVSFLTQKYYHFVIIYATLLWTS